MMKTRFLPLGLTVFAFFITSILTGCDQKPNMEKEAGKSVQTIQQEVKEMAVKDLKKLAIAYSEEINRTKNRMKDLQSELRTVPADQLMGKQAEAIKTEFATLTLKVSQLAKRYDVYAQRYLQEGGQLADITSS